MTDTPATDAAPGRPAPGTEDRGDAPEHGAASLAAPPALASMRERSRGTLLDRMGIELVEVGPERTVATMPVEGNTQPFGLLHGGASVVLAETVGSIAAQLHAGPGRMAVGVDINATHHRSATQGVVTGVASALHLGRSTAAYDVVVTDDQGRRICTSRITCMLRDLPPR